MKTRQSTRRTSKRPVRSAKAGTPPPKAEEAATFGRRRPREIELERAPARSATPRESAGSGSLLRAIVDRLFR